MSDPRRSSYYEVALTNRQVVTAFLTLLVCLVGAFLAGVWVARSSYEAEPPILLSDLDDEAASEGEPQTEGVYRFFDGGRSDGSPAGAAPPQPSGQPVQLQQVRPAEETEAPPALDALSTDEGDADGSEIAEANEPGGDESPDAEATSEAPASGESAATPQPTIRELEPEPEPSSQSPAPNVAAAADEPAPNSDAAAVGSQGQVVIQVFSSADEAQARAVLARLESNAFGAFLSPVAVDGQSMYRVRVGPFDRRSDAEGEADRLRREYRLDTWITSAEDP